MSLTVEQRLAALEEENTQFKMCLGLARLMAPRLGQDEWKATDKYETPSGDLNVADNIRQLRIDWAAVHEELDAHEASIVALDDRTAPVDNSAQIASLAARVTALEQRPVGTASASSGSTDIFAAFEALGVKFGASVHAPLIIESKNGVGIYLQSDTDNTTGQRDPGTTFPQWFGIALSGDGGGGLFQNIIYPEDGSPAYIPDPTRMAVTWRIDRLGAMSVDVMTAGAEFAPGRYTVVSNLGQCFVFGIENSNMIFRMPQENSALYLELGYGGNPSHVDGAGNLIGHRETKFRRRIALEGGWE